MRRRRFLGTLGAGALMPTLSWADVGSPAYVAAARDPDDSYALYGLGADGTDRFRIALPGRGHAAAAHPTLPEAVAFARRPGTFALVMDCLTGAVLHRIEAPEGHHFYGHGAFLQGGALLVTTENHIDSGAGRLGLWAADRGYRRIGDLPTHGIGPHEVVALSDTQVAVANGGILTHPDHGRDKLNIPTMQPSLVYLDLDAGLQEQVTLAPELHMASIRHLAADRGTVAFAMQWQGDLSEVVPLLGLHRRGDAPILCEADFAEQMAMKGYAGSVAISGGVAGITSPRGGRVHLFDLSGAFQDSIRRTDVCGLARAEHGLMATDGLGAVLRLDHGVTPLAVARRAWDNHLVPLI